MKTQTLEEQLHDERETRLDAQARLLDPVKFWPDRLMPYSVTLEAGDKVFLLLDEGEKILVSLSQEPTAGDSRWIPRELVNL